MKRLTLIAVFSALLFSATSFAQQQDGKEPDILEVCETQADRLQTTLDLEDWQTFYVDSILKNDYQAMRAELNELQRQRVSNPSMYQDVQDKWMERIDNAYRKIFTDKQWEAYLKQGAAKAQSLREKRRQKAAQALVKGKKK